MGCPGKPEMKCCSGKTFIPARYALAFMAFMGMFNVYAQRVCLSPVIVAMVNYTAIEIPPQSTNESSKNEFETECKDYKNSLASDFENQTNQLTAEDGPYAWDKTTQGTILAAYFYGYVFSQTPGAWLGRRYSAVLTWGISFSFASLLTLLIPVAVSSGGATGLIVMRIFVGFFSGVSFPVMHGMWGNWAPPLERSRLTSIHFAGNALGSFVILPVAGIMASSYGWQSVFYLTGAVGLFWSFSWMLLMYDTPALHPRISEEERSYIISSLQSNSKKVSRKRSVPWKSMLTSPKVICVAYAHFCANIGRYIVLTMLPTYLVNVLHFNVKTSGILSSIPFITKFLLMISIGSVADFFIGRKVKTIYVRKVLGALALLVPALSIAIVSYVSCNVWFTLLCFTLIVSMDALTVPGFKACLVDMAPDYCGLLFSFGNILGSCAGFISPQVVGLLREANKENPLNGWRAGFWLGAAIYTTGAIGFLIFGSSERQSWAEKKENQIPEENKIISS